MTKPHLFNPLVAQELNIECAVILYNIEFWITKNEANDIHFYDGKYWTYNSIEAFTKLFPYMTKKVIYNALQKLINSGYLIKGCFNKNKFDQTKWYALGKKRSSDLDYSNDSNKNIHIPKRENGLPTQGKSYIGNTDINLTDINTYINIDSADFENRNLSECVCGNENQNNNELASTDFNTSYKLIGFDLELAFNKFWELYPNHKSKPYAKQCFNRCFKKVRDKQSLFDNIITGLEKYKIYLKSRQSDECFIKHASTWLNQECWNDEYNSPSGNKLTKSKGGKYVADEDFGYDEMKAWLQGGKND